MTTEIEIQEESQIWSDAHLRTRAYTPESPEQAKAAYDLADAYGHEWARALEGEQLERWLAGKLSCGEVHDLTVANNYGGGLVCPDLAEDSEYNFYHRTGSGRLAWTVTADGTVILEIYRPGQDGEGEIALQVITSQDEVDCWFSDESTSSKTATVYEGRAIYVRHVHAIKGALEVLLGNDRAAEAVEPLWDVAIPQYDDREEGTPLENFIRQAEKACRTSQALIYPAVYICSGRGWDELKGWRIERRAEDLSISARGVWFPLPTVWTVAAEARLRKAVAFAEEFFGGEDC